MEMVASSESGRAVQGDPYHNTSARRPSRRRRWILLFAAVALLIFVMREVLFPFRGQEYLEISHGDHSHYVPRDRDPNVSISNFPTTPPGPNERILPDGRLAPK